MKVDNFFKWIAILFFVFSGVDVVMNKEIYAPYSGQLFILGNWAYLIGGVLIALGIYMLNYEYKKLRSR